MLKKALGLVITAVMLLGIFGLTACNNDTLDAYKTAGKTAIETYAQERKDNYCDDSWTVVCGIVEAGKQAVDDAMNKVDVDTAVMTTKAEIDAVQNAGTFYSLQKAFDNGWLTKEDLQSIAYYLNDDSMPVYPEALSAEVEKAIKETRASDLRNSQASASNATAADVTILAYYGSYAGSVAVMLSDIYYGFTRAEWSETIAGTTFYYNNGNSILIWREDNMNLETQAKQTYLDTVLKSEHLEATIADISFRPFLGIYNGSLVAAFYGGQYHGEFPDVEISYELEGLLFTFSRGYPILVWNDGNICELPEAYERGLLTKENLVTINNLLYV